MYVCMYPVQVSRFQSFSTYEVATLSRVQWDRCSKSIPPTPSLSPFTNISDIQVLVTYFFSTTPIKLKLGLQVRGTILKLKLGTGSGWATHLDQSNYLPNQKQRAVNKYDFTVFIILIHGSESCGYFQGPRTLPVDSLDLTDEPHPRFLVQGHILSIGGDALMARYTFWALVEML